MIGEHISDLVQERRVLAGHCLYGRHAQRFGSGERLFDRASA